MKLPALCVAVLPGLFQQAVASLNCTIAVPTATQRLCEWDGCEAFATPTANAVIHAGCRADCSTDEDPWFKLYDGSYIRADNETVTGCRYHCIPFAVLGLPKCYQEAGAAAPTSCGSRSSAGVAGTLPTPDPLGPEPAPFAQVASQCSLGAPTPVVTPATP